MGKIYKGQTKLRLTANSKITDLSGCSCKIKYRKPGGTESYFASSSVAAPYIHYDVSSSSDLGESGLWKFWAHVTWNDGTEANGEPVEILIYNVGE